VKKQKYKKVLTLKGIKNVPPKMGDKIVHYEPYFDRESKGKVVEILSAQFIYETKDGQTRHCLFKEDWNLTH
jgi:hypothetical protein